MVNIVEKNIMQSEANIIVIPVDCTGELSGLSEKVSSDYPLVEKEYIKYVKKSKKDKLDMLGKVQYIPSESWAMVMVDTMKNNHIEAYDDNYKYIASAFVKETSDSSGYTDLISVHRCLLDIESKARSIGATVAIPYKFACGRNAKWDDIYKIVSQVFDRSDVVVEICKNKK